MSTQAEFENESKQLSSFKIVTLIEVVGIIIALAASVLLHLAVRKKFAENDEGDLQHQLIHYEHYQTQLNTFLEAQDTREKGKA